MTCDGRIGIISRPEAERTHGRALLEQYSTALLCNVIFRTRLRLSSSGYSARATWNLPYRFGYVPSSRQFPVVALVCHLLCYY